MDLDGIKSAVRRNGNMDLRRDFNRFAISLRGGEQHQELNEEALEFRSAFGRGSVVRP